MGEKDVWTDPEVWKDFDRAWAEAKIEIFRLQLLPTYRVPGEEKEFMDYINGKAIIPSKEFEEWKNQLSELHKKGIRIINLIVVDKPPSDYVKFSIDIYLSKTRDSGQETLLLYREDAKKIAQSHEDFWMFDKKIVIPMKYDNEGHFLGTGKKVSSKDELANYIKIRNAFLKNAVPMDEFVKSGKLNKGASKTKSLSY